MELANILYICDFLTSICKFVLKLSLARMVLGRLVSFSGTVCSKQAYLLQRSRGVVNR